MTFRYHPEYESIDIGGENLTQTKKYRDALHHGRAAFVVDDVLPPMHMRMVEIRGTVEGLPVGGKEMMVSFAPEIQRIRPTRIISFGLLQENTQSDFEPSVLRHRISHLRAGNSRPSTYLMDVPPSLDLAAPLVLAPGMAAPR